MFTNVNLSAPVGALGFLGTAFVLFVVLLAFLYLLVRRKTRLAVLAALAGISIAAIYTGLMLVFSFASTDHVLTRRQEKHFCEIDCHLAYSILDVRQTKTLGNPPNQQDAAGTFYVVTIRTRFDETTIGALRGNAPLTPNSRLVTILDEHGRVFSPSPDGQQPVESGTPLATPLRPGESYTTTVVFDLPADVRNPTLLIREGEWITSLIIGHENSPLHKTTRFRLDA